MPSEIDTQNPADVTQLLLDAQRGDTSAFDRLWSLVYDELQRIAHAQLRRERDDHTLHTTGLVHEAYLKLADQTQVEWRSRAQFFAICARAMRQILIDYARKRTAEKRGGDQTPTTLSGKPLGFEVRMHEFVALDEALNRLDAVDERLRQVVEYKFFGGMTEKEVAEVLGISARTVQRDWVKARAWLYKELYANGS